MLCSRCSEVVRPIVAIDIDGTLGDYHGHLFNFADQYLGKSITYHNYTGQCKLSTWFCSVYGVDITTFRQVKLAYRQGGMKRNMPIHVGAKELVQQLRHNGVEVWLTTTRPYLRLDNVDPDTRFWLNRHSIEFDGILYDEDKYARLAELVDPARVVAVLDDLVEQCQAAEEVFGEGVPIWRLTNYNGHEGYRENNVSHLAEARNQIQQQVEEWRSTCLTT